MNDLPLQPLVWHKEDDFSEGNSRSLTHCYSVVTGELGKLSVAYYLLSGGTYTKYATGFSNIEDAKEWCWNHYNEKMQPYVKPSPTWIDAKKQLPQVDVDTQFICKYDSAIEPYCKVSRFDKSLNEFYYEHGSVLAWMPIPDFKESDCE